MTRLAAVLLVLFAAVVPASAADMLPVRQAEILLDGASTFGGMALDAAAGRLYLAHGSVVDVVDLAKGDAIGTVEGADRARGVVVLPDLKRGFVVAAKKNRLVAFELATWKVLKEVPVGDSPDAALYVPIVREVWVFNRATNDVTCVDPNSLEVKATIKLDASPRGAIENPTTGMVFVGLVEPDSIGVVDPRTRKVQATHEIQPSGEPNELAYDSKNGLLFIGCENANLIVVETVRWRTVFKLEAETPAGAIAYDPGTANAYFACEAAVIVLHENSPKWVVKADKTLDAPGGGAAVMDVKAKKLYLATGPKKGEEGRVQILVFQQR